MTAKEIYWALKSNESCSQRMIVFFREIEDINDLDVKLKSKLSDTVDEETQHLLDDIKTCIRNALPPENILTYRVCPL